MKLRLGDIREHLIYGVVWTILFVSPLIIMVIQSRYTTELQFEWDEIFRIWRVFGSFLLLFTIHDILLAPRWVYRGKKWSYLIPTISLLLFFAFYQCNRRPHGPHRPPIETRERQQKMEEDGPVPPEFRETNQGRLKTIPPMHKPDKEWDMPLFLGQMDMANIFIAIMMLALNVGLKYYFRSLRISQKLHEVERKNLLQQLEYLKYQINPHFFLNTLNNIHALIDIEPKRAKESVIILSKLMRYVLYEGDKQLMPLYKENEFVKNYIKLMKLRYTDHLRITVNNNCDKGLEECLIAPMLTISFVENAFKYGVSYQEDSFIDIDVHNKDLRFFFCCRNSNHKQAESVKEKGGVGLVNTRRRLELIYGSKFHLETTDNNETYEVKLDIPLQKSITNKPNINDQSSGN